MGSYDFLNNWLAFCKEKVFRCGYTSGTQSVPVYLSGANLQAWDLIEEEVEIPEPTLKKEESFPLGTSSRNVGLITEQGYELVEKDLPIKLQTAIWLYYVLGTCSTSGTGDPYTHAITEANTLPSAIIHSQNSTDMVRDYLGVIVKKVEIVIEKGEKVKATVSIMVPKGMDGQELSGSKPTRLDIPIYTWDMINKTNSIFTYNSANIEGSVAGFFNVCDSITISIENTIDYIHPLGDENAYIVQYGKRDYSIKFHYFPTTTNTTLWTLSRTKLTSYATALAFTLDLYQSANRYIKLTFNNLYVQEWPTKVVTEEQKVLGVDVTLKVAPAYTGLGGAVAQGTCVIESKDSLTAAYYETGG